MNKIIIVIIVLLLSIDNIHSQTVVNQYSACLVELASTVGIVIPPDNLGSYNFCAYYNCFEGVVVGFNFTQTTDKVITKNLIDCYPGFKDITMRNWNTEEDFLQFTTKLSLESITMVRCSGFSLKYKINAFKLTLELHLPIVEPVKLSNIIIPLQKSGVTILNIPFTGGIVSFENDLDSTTEISDFTCYVSSIPDMSNIISRSKIHYIFNPSTFDIGSFYNIRTHSSIINLEIESSLTFDTSKLFESLVNFYTPINNDYKITFCYLSFPISSQINFGGHVLFQHLYFTIIGSNNNILFPFRKLPLGLETLYYNNGNIDSLFTYNILEGTNITSFNIRNSSITGPLPSWNQSYDKVIRINLQNNLFIGTIDSSYCSVILNVRNNQMDGLLPECYACNLNDPLFRYNFVGNHFLNIDSNLICETIPNMKMYKDQLLFFGKNLGYDLNYDIQPPINGLEIVKPNSVFSTNQYTPNRIVHSVKSTLTGQLFYVTPDPYPPQLYTITVYQGNLIIMGQYFTYNSSLVSVVIGDYDCQVDYATFNQINCTMVSGYPSSIVNGIITVDGLFSTFNIHLDDGSSPLINNYSSCIDQCNYPNGKCDYNTGTCSCKEGREIDCSFECIGSCNHGRCNKGYCSCDVGYTGINCNLKAEQPCLNNCTDESHGICDNLTGVCKCNSNWFGLDCSSPYNSTTGGNGPKTNSTVNPDGSTTVINENTSYNIYITSLLELDLNGNQVNIYRLEKNWIVNETLDNEYNSTISFSQTLNNTKCKVELLVQEIKKDSNYSFAGIDLNLQAGSIKVSVSIINYEYQSPLNTLQLQMISNVTSNSNDCNSKSAESTTSLFDDQLLNYITISRDNRILYGRFINRALSDNKPSFISTSLISNQDESITIGINIPHCNLCQIDPDFSVLLTSDFKSQCNESRKSYVIPVAVVLSAVGVAMVVCVSYILYKKRESLLFKRQLIKLNDLKT